MEQTLVILSAVAHFSELFLLLLLLPQTFPKYLQCVPVVTRPEQHERHWTDRTHHGKRDEAEELEVVARRRRQRDDEERHEGQTEQLTVRCGHLGGRQRERNKEVKMLVTITYEGHTCRHGSNKRQRKEVIKRPLCDH